MYIYENHLGGIYATDEPQDYDDLYCEECGDSDWEIGQAGTLDEARQLLTDQGYCEQYSKEYIEWELMNMFPIGGDGSDI